MTFASSRRPSGTEACVLIRGGLESERSGYLVRNHNQARALQSRKPLSWATRNNQEVTMAIGVGTLLLIIVLILLLT